MEIIEGGLEDNEYVTLLSWTLNVYTGKEFMGDPALGLNIASLGPLLDNKILDQLIAKYLNVRWVNFSTHLLPIPYLAITGLCHFCCQIIKTTDSLVHDALPLNFMLWCHM